MVDDGLDDGLAREKGLERLRTEAPSLNLRISVVCL